MDRQEMLALIKDYYNPKFYLGARTKLICSYLKDKGYTEEDMEKALTTLALHNIIGIVSEDIIEHYRRIFSINALYRIIECDGKAYQKLLMVF